MSNFKAFAKQIHSNLLAMQSNNAVLFEVGIPADQLPKDVVDRKAHFADRMWEVYLASFPEGSDPLYIKRSTHDCSCCKNFIRNVGNVVAIDPSTYRIVTIWDGLENLDYPYKQVAEGMNMMIGYWPIVSKFLAAERKYGAETTHQMLEGGAVKSWNHFHTEILPAHFNANPGSKLSEYNGAHDVLSRSLEMASAGTLELMLELAKNGTLYRGEEHIHAIEGFSNLLSSFKSIQVDGRDNFSWYHADGKYARFWNSVIGTLAGDLEKGIELDQAVYRFNNKMSPATYQRPTAVVTEGMVRKAMTTITELGIEPALSRRHAVLSDVSINNVLWADSSVKDVMRPGIESLLLQSAVSKKPANTGEKMSIERFVSEMLPQAKSLELFVPNSQQSKLVSITTGLQSNPPLFKWNNPFAWSYNGDFTDSIKERVKAAGGNVDAPLRVSLSWFNYDDLDLHCFEPDGSHIYFGWADGKLDVDMNVGSGKTRTPVENISWKVVKDGYYLVQVKQYNKRESADIGFTLQVVSDDVVHELNYTKPMQSGTTVAMKFQVTRGKIASIDYGDMVGGSAAVPGKDKWGITTESFHKVATVMYSPNYWDDNRVGNKHYMFMIDKCVNPDGARGIYNEFLSNELSEHRKVFELLGSKTKCAPAANQLSGLGFSSTNKDVIKVRVNSSRVIEVQF